MTRVRSEWYTATTITSGGQGGWKETGLVFAPYVPLHRTTSREESYMRYATHLKVPVKTAELLVILKENRAKHAEDFEKNMALYRERCIDELEKRLAKVREGSIKPRMFVHFNLPTPKSFVQYYDQVIGMLEMTPAEEIIIDGDQFQAWIHDKWDWKNEYMGSIAMYSGEM